MAVDITQAATALLTEHLQYTPLALIDDIIDMVNNLVYQGVASLENGMFSTPPERLGFKSISNDAHSEAEYPEAKQEIEEGLHKLETLLNATVDKNFDKFEIYVLRNVLSLPADLADWVRLNHYQNLPYPVPENTPTAEFVQLLRRKAAASRMVTNALMDEYNRNEAILAQLRAIAASGRDTPNAVSQDQNRPNLGFLTQSPSASAFHMSASNSGDHPLTTNSHFTLSQLPALRSLLAELRPKLATLKTTALSQYSAKDERREERRVYIEQRTRACLERNEHATTENARIPSGKIADQDEIEALEKVAAIFDT